MLWPSSQGSPDPKSPTKLAVKVKGLIIQRATQMSAKSWRISHLTEWLCILGFVTTGLEEGLSIDLKSLSPSLMLFVGGKLFRDPMVQDQEILFCI